MSDNRKNYWIILDHPKQFLIALYLTTHIKKKHGGKVNLLISKHEYWKYFDIKKYKNNFGSITWFGRLDYPPPMMNKIKQFLASLLLVPRLFFLKLKSKTINFHKQDVIIGLSLCQFLENMILSNNPYLKSISILPLSEYFYYENKPDPKNFVLGFSSKFSGWIIKVFGMYETIYSHRKGRKKLGDGDYFLAFRKSLKDIYSGIILTVTKVDRNMSKLQSDAKNNNIFVSEYPDIEFGKIDIEKKKKIVFMGQPLLLLGNRDKKSYLNKLNQCLNYLYKVYGKKYELIYKTHPRENIDDSLLDLKQYRIEKKRQPAEIYFMENKENIEAVFSVSSSTSRSALNAGIKSYLFAKLFQHDKNFIKDLYMACGEILDNSFITSFKLKPKDLFLKRPRKNNFLNYIDILIR